MLGKFLGPGIAALVVMTFALGATVAPASAGHGDFSSKSKKISCTPPLVRNGDTCLPCPAGTHYSSTTKKCVN